MQRVWRAIKGTATATHAPRAASLRGVDVLALTGGIGEHDKALLSELQDDLEWLPQLKIVVVPADEEGMMARLCRRQSAEENNQLRSGKSGV